MKKINKKLQTVTIGIPAFNEEKNIINLLDDILNQDLGEIELKEIIINLDGCSDNTFKLLKNIKSKKIKIINNFNRLGKPKRINEIFKIANTDIVVILDADIKISSKNVLCDLVAPLLREGNIQLTSGKAFPIKPVNLVQRVVDLDRRYWDECKYSLKTTSNVYMCDGSIRAFKRKLFKEIEFNDYSADDAYSYIYCISKNYSFVFVDSAIVYFGLPTSLLDYIHQIKRYTLSSEIQSQLFPNISIKSYFNISFTTKIKILIKFFIKNPILMSLYLAIYIISKISNYFSSEKSSMWKILNTTKFNYAK